MDVNEYETCLAHAAIGHLCECCVVLEDSQYFSSTLWGLDWQSLRTSAMTEFSTDPGTATKATSSRRWTTTRRNSNRSWREWQRVPVPS